MPIRNPFTRRPQAEEGLRAPLTIDPPLKTPPGFERVDTVGSKASSAALSISSRRSNDTGEYKMSGTCEPPRRMNCHASHPWPVMDHSAPFTPLSIMPRNEATFSFSMARLLTDPWNSAVVNDSGVYLPPSPTDDKPSWRRRYLSRNSTDTRSEVGEIEPFGISRESFDSYRRSFVCLTQRPLPPPPPPSPAWPGLMTDLLGHAGCLRPLSSPRQ